MALISEKYSIQESIGEGALSIVYKAIDKTNNEFAIKVFDSDKINNPEALLRFNQEASIISHINHPNIIKIHSIEKEKNNYFLVMEYFHATTFKEKIQSLDYKQKLDVLIKITEALEFIHEKEILHRDIKPENIVLQFDVIMGIF